MKEEVKKINLYISEKYKIRESSINKGYCFLWALEFKKRFYDSTLYLTKYHGGHAFIFYNGRFYDSETPNGAKSWHRLNTFRRDRLTKKNRKNIIILQKEEFKKYWVENNKSNGRYVNDY